MGGLLPHQSLVRLGMGWLDEDLLQIIQRWLPQIESKCKLFSQLGNVMLLFHTL